MHHRHLRQAEHHDERHEARQGVAEDHRRAGVADGKPAAHEQAGADRPAEADHDDLGLAKTPMQAAFHAR